MCSIRILLADDHHLIRECLRRLLESQPNLEVIAEAADGREAVRLAEEFSPDVVLMDIEMPGLNGVDATQQIVSRVPTAAVVALTAFADEQHTTRMLHAGACGYVPKASAFQEVADAVRAAAARQIYISPQVAGGVVEALRRHETGNRSSAFESLSLREREVLQLLAEGKATKQVAAAMHVSIKTIETHRRHIMDKLGVYSVAELTKYAIREGLTSAF